MTEEFSLNRIDKVRYRPTRDAEEFLEQLRRTLIPGEKFRVARLAISRSLVEAGDPPLIVRGSEMGSAIEGSHLFGDDTSVWACLVTEAAAVPPKSLEALRNLVEAHWDRGSRLLQADFESAGQRDVDFAVRLAELAGNPSGGTGAGAGGTATPASSVRLSVRFGEIGIEQRTNTPIDIGLNAPGASPHLALMGKTRSGKTRTGLTIAERIVHDANIPLLLIDPKGEFVKNGSLVAKSEWGNRTIADKFPGIEPIDVPMRPVPLDFLALATGASQTFVAQAAISFRDSFQKCIRTKGDVAMDNLRELVDGLLNERRGALSLERIRDAVRDANEAAGRKKDTVEAKLNELTSLRLFEPSLAPAEFFRKRWVISLGGATDESKRLVMFLVLDALANYLLSQSDSTTDALGYRAIRHLLVVDEAKEILAYRHGALSNLVRKSAAKGGIVMLLSQSPEDFEQEADDFLAQMGTIGVFASNAQSVKNLRAALGKRVNPEDFSDRDLPKGVALVKTSARDATKVLAWK